MSEAEYIDLLWRIITAEGLMLLGLIAWSVSHFFTDRRVRDQLRRCMDKLGINGVDL